MVEFLETLHWGALFQIIMIDILLGGDNAVVIALACRKLEHRQRIRGILWGTVGAIVMRVALIAFALTLLNIPFLKVVGALLLLRSEEHTSELQSLMRISYAVFCLKKKNTKNNHIHLSK